MVTKKKPSKPTVGRVSTGGSFKPGGGQLPRYNPGRTSKPTTGTKLSVASKNVQPRVTGRLSTAKTTRGKATVKPRPTGKGTAISSSTRSNLTAAQRQALQRRRNKARLNKRISTRK